MAPVINERVLFNSLIPATAGRPNDRLFNVDTAGSIDPETVPLNGGFLVKVLDVSLDPYLKLRLLGEGFQPSFLPLFSPGEQLYAHAVGVVLRSEFQDIATGDHVYGILAVQNYVVQPSLEGLFKISRPEDSKIPWSAFLGVLGSVGRTAYTGWKEYSQAKKGETVFVSTGAGVLAKADGLKVIASASSDEKVEFMKEIGADVAFNYKTTDTRAILKEEGPIDIFWDNVGGETLDAALEAAAPFSRFIECGMTSTIGQVQAHPINNALYIVAKNITIHGFLVDCLQQKYPHEKYLAEFVPKVALGKIKYRETLVQGLGQIDEGIFAIFEGTNGGKLVVHVADE